MAVEPCQACGEPTAETADECQHCGSKMPTGTSVALRTVYLTFLVPIIATILILIFA